VAKFEYVGKDTVKLNGKEEKIKILNSGKE